MNADRDRANAEFLTALHRVEQARRTGCYEHDADPRWTPRGFIVGVGVGCALWLLAIAIWAAALS